MISKMMTGAMAALLALATFPVTAMAQHDELRLRIHVQRVCPEKGAGVTQTVYGTYGPKRDYTKLPKWVARPPAGAKAAHIMHIRRVRNRIRFVRLQTETPSGDWVQTIDYCFYATGHLGYIHAKLRTFQGNVIVSDRQVWKKTGQRIYRDRKIRDLKSGKLLRPGARSFFEPKYPIFISPRDVKAYAKPAVQ